uniref:D-isomer specific 2-hydroxyacid dehydrogenase NAD-binding domain-containing protein n=1 Tax=Leersia perrieri TaxID=77586 RepID=A0A0D9W1S9_9ORYZ
MRFQWRGGAAAMSLSTMVATSSAAPASGKPPAILLLRPVDPPFAVALRERFRVLDFLSSGEPLPAFLAAAAAVPDPPRAAVVMGGGAVRVDGVLFDAVPSLRCVVSTAAGIDHIDLPECARRGVVVANSGKVYSADVADHAVGMLIDVMRRVSAADRYVRRGLWPLQGDYPLGSKLSGKRVGIIGLGNIGSLIAKRLEAFGCVISYNSRKPKDSVPYSYFADVRALAADSDVLVVSCALNKETRRIVDGEVLDALGPGGVLINIGRGANVDEAELVRALREGRIAGAGLDVFDGEPKKPAALVAMDDKVVMTPHVAVWTTESRSDLRDHTVANLEAFFSGEPLLTPVTMLP